MVPLHPMKVIVTGATGMVGEGVLLECLDNPAVERVLSVARRTSGHSHPKLSECLVPDFRDLTSRAAPHGIRRIPLRRR